MWNFIKKNLIGFFFATQFLLNICFYEKHLSELISFVYDKLRFVINPFFCAKPGFIKCLFESKLMTNKNMHNLLGSSSLYSANKSLQELPSERHMDVCRFAVPMMKASENINAIFFITVPFFLLQVK